MYREDGRPGPEPPYSLVIHWFETGSGSKFKELHTPFLRNFQEAVAQVVSGENPDATLGLGDAAISCILKNLSRLKAVDGQSLAVGAVEFALAPTEDGP